MTHKDQNEGQQVLVLNTWFFDIYFEDCLSLVRIVNKFCFAVCRQQKTKLLPFLN